MLNMHPRALGWADVAVLQKSLVLCPRWGFSIVAPPPLCLAGKLFLFQAAPAPGEELRC